MEEMVWKAIHGIDRATAKDDLGNLTRGQLEQLIVVTYAILMEAVTKAQSDE